MKNLLFAVMAFFFLATGARAGDVTQDSQWGNNPTVTITYVGTMMGTVKVTFTTPTDAGTSTTGTPGVHGVTECPATSVGGTLYRIVRVGNTSYVEKKVDGVWKRVPEKPKVKKEKEQTHKNTSVT